SPVANPIHAPRPAAAARGRGPPRCMEDRQGHRNLSSRRAKPRMLDSSLQRVLHDSTRHRASRFGGRTGKGLRCGSARSATLIMSLLKHKKLLLRALALGSVVAVGLLTWYTIHAPEK